MSLRTGMGYDVHPLVDGRPLILGGLALPFEKGLAGHSDGDVLTHAIIDALLGAASLGDIGAHFPSSDQRYSGISSFQLLREVVDLLAQNRWLIVHLDATIIAELPKVAPFVDRMRENIAEILGKDKADVNIKATTTDGLGFIGKGEGIATLCVATIEEMA